MYLFLSLKFCYNAEKYFLYDILLSKSNSMFCLSTIPLQTELNPLCPVALLIPSLAIRQKTKKTFKKKLIWSGDAAGKNNSN